MQTENRFVDDIVKLMNGAAGTLAGVGREAEASARSRAREWIGGLDFVGRDEFEAVKAMAAAASDEAEMLRARLDALEAATRTPAAAPVAAPIVTAAPVQSQSQGQFQPGTHGAGSGADDSAMAPS